MENTFALSPIGQSLLLATLAGITIPLGGLLAVVETFHNQWIEKEFRHTIIAFGGGILLAAIALVLVPRAMTTLSLWPVVTGFTAGGLAFFLIDRWLDKKGGSVSQLLALLLDFIPEAMALGALITEHVQTAILLSILIAFQNLPEGFNAYCEIRASRSSSTKKILGGFCLLVLVGPLSALVGTQFLADASGWLAGIMIFSSGGILYLIFQDISPQVPLAQSWAPPLGSVGGFLVGIVGHMVLHGG